MTRRNTGPDGRVDSGPLTRRLALPSSASARTGPLSSLDRREASGTLQPREVTAKVADTSGPAIVEEGPQTVVASFEHTALLTVRHGLSGTAITSLDLIFAQLQRRYGTFNCLGFVEPGRFESSAADRTGLTELALRYSGKVLGSALAYEGTGFGATAVRSMLTAVQLATKSSNPIRIFAQPLQAIAWLEESDPARALNRVALLLGVAHMRQRMARLAGDPPEP